MSTGRVAITGLGAITPLGGDVESTWAAMLSAKSGVRALEESWAANFPIRIAGQVPCDPATLLDRVEARRLDRSQQLALIAAREAWADAGRPQVEPERLAVVIGTGIGGALTMLAQDDVCEAKGPKLLSPFTIPMLMPNGAAAVVSIDLGARGGAHAPMSACASGAEAIAIGWGLIRSGRADVVVAGGTDACLHPLSMGGFARMGALSRRNDRPTEASRPFDRDRDGFVMAEGAATVVLERAEFAVARGGEIHAILAGGEVTSDAQGMTTPSMEGQVRAMRSALAVAGLEPQDITHVNAHATGTPVGDLVEAEAIAEVIGMHPLVTAPKSVTGHMLGGAGAVEAIFSALAVRDGQIPPTINVDHQDPAVKLTIVTEKVRSVDISGAISNSFGFGGHNVVLAFAPASGSNARTRTYVRRGSHGL